MTTSWFYLSIALPLALLLSFIYYPNLSNWVSSALFVFGLGMAVFFTIQRHMLPYKEGEITRVKLARNILLDLLGLLLAISWLGRMAGAWAINYGLWTGLAAGMIVSFAGAWGAKVMMRLHKCLEASFHFGCGRYKF